MENNVINKIKEYIENTSTIEIYHFVVILFLAVSTLTSFLGEEGLSYVSLLGAFILIGQTGILKAVEQNTKSIKELKQKEEKEEFV